MYDFQKLLYLCGVKQLLLSKNAFSYNLQAKLVIQIKSTDVKYYV